MWNVITSCQERPDVWNLEWLMFYGESSECRGATNALGAHASDRDNRRILSAQVEIDPQVNSETDQRLNLGLSPALTAAAYPLKVSDSPSIN